MAQIIVNRTTGTASTETRLRRDVSSEMAYLYAQVTPLVTFLQQFAEKTKVPTFAMKYEWPETDYVATWASNSATAVANFATATLITVTDSTLFVAGDLVAVPKAVGSSAQPEIFQVLSKPATNAMYVTRGVNGSSNIDTIAADAALAILAPAYEEGSSRPAAKMVSPTMKYNYIQTFRTTFGFSRQAMAVDTFNGAGGDFEREKQAKAKEHQIAINRQFLWGAASEALTGGPSGNPLRTTGGLNSVISTNVVDGGGTLTEAKFREFCRTVVNAGGGSEVKYLVASPLIADALDYWATAKLHMQIKETQYGLKIREVEMGGGIFMVVTDRSLASPISGKNGMAGWAFAVDPNAIKMRVLQGNGVDGNTHYIEYGIKEQNGVDSTIGEYISDLGLQVELEKLHGKLFNVTAYS